MLVCVRTLRTLNKIVFCASTAVLLVSFWNRNDLPPARAKDVPEEIVGLVLAVKPTLAVDPSRTSR